MRADKKKFSTRLMAALMAGTLAAGMMGMNAVSYTHLDVYKRQHQEDGLEMGVESGLRRKAVL